MCLQDDYLEKEFGRLKRTVNKLFFHERALYYELDEMKFFLSRTWGVLELTGMALNRYCTMNDILYPLKDSDFAKAMAFMFFIWKTERRALRKRIVSILQDVERRSGGDSKKGTA